MSRATEHSNAQRPNFIVILADDLGYGDLAWCGSNEVKTHYLDQFAMEGVRFTDCSAALPLFAWKHARTVRACGSLRI